ncbi:SCY1 protein kinase Ppk32 [Schizosaccharomyces japonicus yFS275]|uniref:SCY1 protein kinase Ppk32 n=1 Tax=Schizosaccharomyces japonicus (strain yFS275 / FY16936) TaxID=402676 RepID=B6JWV0_SCHJY|nr:SCY1 protein kinase Ppk32 [Schizosaccharomyces japonicus yFS275]EEB05851.1 SCY1 protein kinase Ppk32 [Schizosaccharomyces japonicus yFS275]
MFGNALKFWTNSKSLKNNYHIDAESETHVGPWVVYSARKKDSHVVVSVFTFDKKPLKHLQKQSSMLRPRVEFLLNVLRKDASTLARLRHPSVLRLMEPLEETSSSMTFVTEPIEVSLSEKLRSFHQERAESMEELEIQKGLLQLTDGLEFLSNSAGIVHLNVQPESVVIDAKGDWKICGFGYSQNLTDATFQFPEMDSRFPIELQQNFNFLAPEYLLDEVISPANDVFSLGCLTFAIFNSGNSFITSYDSTFTYKKELDEALNSKLFLMKIRSDPLKVFLESTLTRYPQHRVSVSDLHSLPYFNSGLLASLQFLERLPEKLPSEKTSFLQSLKSELHIFPKTVSSRKILPCLLETLSDPSLIVYLLPCIFEISTWITPEQFQSNVFPQIAVLLSEERDVDESVATLLLENVQVFKSKLSADTFVSKYSPFLVHAITSSYVNIQRLALTHLDQIVDVSPNSTIADIVVPKLTDCCAQTKNLGVKALVLEKLNLLAQKQYLSSFVVVNKVIPTLKAIKTRENIVVSLLREFYKEISSQVPDDTVVKDIIPSLLDLSFSTSISLEEFQANMSLTRGLLDTFEATFAKKLRPSQTYDSVKGNRGYVATTHQPQSTSTNTSTSTLPQTQQSFRKPATQQSPVRRAFSSQSSFPPLLNSLSTPSLVPTNESTFNESASVFSDFASAPPNKASNSNTFHGVSQMEDLGGWKSLL